MTGSALALPRARSLRGMRTSEQEPRHAAQLLSNHEAPSSPAPGSRPGTPILAPVWPSVRLRLASEQTAALHRHIPTLAATVREIAHRHHPACLVIDLTELAPGPYYQELACLCAVLRRILGPRIRSFWPG